MDRLLYSSFTVWHKSFSKTVSWQEYKHGQIVNQIKMSCMVPALKF